MSEQTAAAANNVLSQPESVVNRVLRQESLPLSMDAELYPPENIGLPSVMDGGEQISVVGELTIPVGAPDKFLSAVILKSTSVDGTAVVLGIGGLTPDENGRHASTGRFLQLELGTTLQIGRIEQVDEGSAHVAASDLWPAGSDYGDVTSGKQVGITLTEQGIEVNDTSTNGTYVRGRTASPSKESVEAPKIDDDNLDRRLRMSNQYAISPYDVHYAHDQIAELIKSNPTADHLEMVTSVIADGIYEGTAFGSKLVERNAYRNTQDRIFVAKLAATSPEAAHEIVSNNIIGLHATKSFALAALIQSGNLFSSRVLAEQGSPVASGAHDSRVGGQDSISFGVLSTAGENISAWGGIDAVYTDAEVDSQLQAKIALTDELLAGQQFGIRGHGLVEDSKHASEGALKFFLENPNSLLANMMRYQFPVAIGVRADFVEAAEDTRINGRSIHHGASQFGEFRPNAEKIPIEALPVIAVPANRVVQIQELLREFGRDAVSVLSIEDIVRAAAKR